MKIGVGKYNMKVSIIIATYNAEEYLNKAIESVLNQNYQNLELIIVDGLSKDNTINILDSYGDKIKYISEKDKGISDAFNKGIKNSTGDFIYFLGADDFFLADNVVEEMIKGVSINDMIICGKIKRVDITGEKCLWIAPKSLNFRRRSLLFKMSLPHQAIFMNREFFNRYGNFEVENKYSMDYELLLRAYKEFPKVIMKDILVAAWREGGIGADRTLDVLKGYRDIKIKNKVQSMWFIYFVYFLDVFKYRLKSFINGSYINEKNRFV